MVTVRKSSRHHPPPTENEDWSPSLVNVLDHPASTLPFKLALGGIVFCGLFMSWAWFGQVDEVAKGQGKLIPSGETAKVHPVELGKIDRILVKEGETVQAGQVLAKFETEVETNEIERLQQLLQIGQLELQQTQTLLDKAYLEAQKQAEIAHLQAQAQETVIVQARLGAATNQQILAQLEGDATAQQQRLQRLEPLVTEGAFSREQVFTLEQSLRDRQRSIIESRGNLQKALVEVDHLQADLRQKQAEAQQQQLATQQQIRQLQIKLTELQAKTTETQSSLAIAKAKLKHQYLYAPIAGVVLSLNVRQRGEVLQPGQTIAEIAPQGKPLVLSTKLPSSEAGFVKVGMPVKIKLDAFPYQDYGVLKGSVLSISHDSKPDERLGQVYRVDVSLSQAVINNKGQLIKVQAGQTGTAEIITKQRRIADVLFDPIKKLQGSFAL